MNGITLHEGAKFADIVNVNNTSIIQGLTVAGLTSDKSKASYSTEIAQFIEWLDATGAKLSPLAIQAYKDYLIDKGSSASKVNLALSALRRMAKQAQRNKLVSRATSDNLRDVENVKQEGVRTGNWLTLDEAQQLISSPNIKRIKGLRDRAILAVFIGAGLRRTELVNLQLDDIQQRDARWVIVDIIGKGGRVRSVPIAPWVKVAIDEWTSAAGITSGYIFLRVKQGGIIVREPITPQAAFYVVKHYAGLCGFDVAPHDLRRTFAKLAYRNGKGAPITQIQLVLGHSSSAITDRYLGTELDLTTSPSDEIDLRLNGG